MIKRLCIWVLLFSLLIPVLAVTASADTGPKPSVVVNFKGLEEETYDVTLLSAEKSTGPWSIGRYEPWYGDEKIWEKFKAYSDADGFYFLGYFSDCSNTDTFEWNYHPPGTFKILIYFPDYDRFVISADAYERYAFDSYYTADATSLVLQSVTASNEEMRVTETYDFQWETISLLCRILATIAIELGVALLFGFRSKKQLLVIGAANIVTQTLLNILLNVINYNQGGFAFILHYIWMEIVVFIIEGFVYARLLRRYEAQPEKNRYPWLYAFLANSLSFAIGMLIAKRLPGIF